MTPLVLKKHRRKLPPMLIEPRNCVSCDSWRLSPLSDFTIFSGFDCDDEDLNDFIINDALKHKEELVAETYLFTFNNAPSTPIAFVSLLNDSIPLSTSRQRRLIPNSIRKYKNYPSVKMGRLGVSKDYQGLNVGTSIVDAIKELFTSFNRTGCRFIIVDAYNKPRVIRFYEKNDFRFFPDQDTTKNRLLMFFDLKRFLPS